MSFCCGTGAIHSFSTNAHELSWMGLYGAQTPKPSYLMGVGWRAQQLHAHHAYVSNIFYPGPPRRWIKGIRNRLTKEKRAQFKVKVVKKKKRADGTTQVSGTHMTGTSVLAWSMGLYTSNAVQLRTGLPSLRDTQVYPAGFGKAIAKLWVENGCGTATQDTM